MDEAHATSRFGFARRVIVSGLLLGAISGTAWSVHASNFYSSGTAGDDYDDPFTADGIFLTDNADFQVGLVDIAGEPVGGNPPTGRYLAITQALGGTSNSITGMMTSPSDLVPVITNAASCTDAAFDSCGFDNSYATANLCGWSLCVGTTTGSHPNARCSLNYVRFDTDITAGNGCGTDRFLACHEFGHSVALHHTNLQPSLVQGCMKSGWTKAQATNTNQGYTTHDLNHFDASY